MKRPLFILSFLTFFLSFCYSQNTQWDKDNAIYVDYDNYFSWCLPTENELTWNKTIGTEKHTVFRAKCNNLPIVVFVNVQGDSNKYDSRDIWDDFELHKGIYFQAKDFLKSKGIDRSYIDFSKTSLFGTHAIKIIAKNIPIDTDNTITEKEVQCTYKVYKNSRLYSVNASIPLEMYDLISSVDGESYDFRDIFQGFKFTATQSELPQFIGENVTKYKNDSSQPFTYRNNEKSLLWTLPLPYNWQEAEPKGKSMFMKYVDADSKMFVTCQYNEEPSFVGHDIWEFVDYVNKSSFVEDIKKQSALAGTTMKTMKIEKSYIAGRHAMRNFSIISIYDPAFGEIIDRVEIDYAYVIGSKKYDLAVHIPKEYYDKHPNLEKEIFKNVKILK